MQFTKGLVLNERYYAEVVGPQLRQFDPQLAHSASLLGYGSDVLGFDDATSMDHNWGPRLQIFLNEQDLHRKDELDAFLATNLPPAFMGLPTNYGGNPGDPIKRLVATQGPPINHLIEIYGIDAFAHSIAGKPLAHLTDPDWVRIPEQVLLEATSGKVFHDGLDKLTPVRAQLRYYPPDVQKLKLAALWQGIANEEAFLSRCAEQGDFTGVKLISTRIMSHLMKICFVIKERYMPYSKWFTVMFNTLGLQPIEDLIAQTLQANDLQVIAQNVARLYREVIVLSNRHASLPEINNEIRNYYGRPAQVVMAGEIAALLVDAIEQDAIKKLDLLTVFIDNKIDGADFRPARDWLQRVVGA